MTVVLIAVILILAVAVIALVAAGARDRIRRPAPARASGARRILFPFVAGALSQRALDAALRLAAAEGATLVPVFLARVSLDLPLESPLPRQCSMAMPLLEAVEQRATEAGIPVDARIVRGRNRRHALRQAIAEVNFDRIVIAASAHGNHGFDPDDVAWLLDNAPGEIVVLRANAEDKPERAAGPGRTLKESSFRRFRARRGAHRVSREGETAASQ
jgi:nucleotide-binding universal stress UspA family protein